LNLQGIGHLRPEWLILALELLLEPAVDLHVYMFPSQLNLGQQLLKEEEGQTQKSSRYQSLLDQLSLCPKVLAEGLILE
jgi:hypothetical protein